MVFSFTYERGPKTQLMIYRLAFCEKTNEVRYFAIYGISTINRVSHSLLQNDKYYAFSQFTKAVYRLMQNQRGRSKN